MPVTRIIAILFFLGLALGINVLCHRRAVQAFRLRTRSSRSLAVVLALSVVFSNAVDR